MGKSAIPDRWLDYMPIGKRIKGTRFIAFKVPLNKFINQNVAKDQQLDVSSLLDQIPDLGIIIDLTNTYRYYSPKDFIDAGIEYQKLMIPGKQTPSNALAERFKLLVTNFLNVNSDNDKLIGVHCTHGVNRTGYLICNFLISQMQLTPAVAINRFNTARGHQIERENYLSALQQLPDTTSTSNVQRGSHESTKQCLYVEGHAGSQLYGRQSQRGKRERPDWRNDDWRRSSAAGTSWHGNSDGRVQYGKRARYDDDDYDDYNRQSDRKYNLVYEQPRSSRNNAQWGYNNCSNDNNMHFRQSYQQQQQSRPHNYRRNDNSDQGQQHHHNNWRQTNAGAVGTEYIRSRSQAAERPKYNLIYERQPARRRSEQQMPRDELFNWRRQDA